MSEVPPSTVFAKTHVVVVRSADFGDRKIFAVGFAKDTVFVHLPYFDDPKGMLLRNIGRIVDSKMSIERTELPHITTNRIKFSYHPNGRAHFSQDGKVRTAVIGSLPPLVVHAGVLFQVWAYGFDHYDRVDPKDFTHSSKKAVVDCTSDPKALGVIVTGHISKPGVCLVESAREPRLVARSPYSSFLIALGFKTLQAPANYHGAYLLFSGGPSAPAIIAPGASRSVLIAAYPRGAATILYPDAMSVDHECD